MSEFETRAEKIEKVLNDLRTGVVCPWCRHVPDPIDWVFSESEDEYPDNKELFAVGCAVCGAHGPFIETPEDAVHAWENWGE